MVPRPKVIGSFHKSGTGNNQGRQRTTPHDNRCSNSKDSQSKSKNLLSPVIHVSPPLNNLVINPPQLSSVLQPSFNSTQNTPGDKRCFNSKDSNWKSYNSSSPVIPMPPPLDDSVINPPQLSSVCQQSSISSHNPTHDLKAYSIPDWISPDPSNTVPPLSTNNVICNIYGCMVDVSKLTPSKQQKHAVILLEYYHELCNTNDPSSMFIYTPPITNIESLSQSTI